MTFNSPFSTALRTNYVPTNLDRNHIRNILVEPSQQLETMNDKISDMERDLLELIQRRNALASDVEEHRRLLSPFRCLPDDMLREIFIACLPDSHNAVMSSKEAPLVLGHVCRRWRTVVYATPRLWSTIHIPVPTPSRRDAGQEEVDAYDKRLSAHCTAINDWLLRSGTCAISLSFFLGYSPIDYTSKDSLGREYLDIIMAYSRRWYSIEIAIPLGGLCDALLSLPSTSVPILKHISLKFPSVAGRTIAERPRDWCTDGILAAPQLQTVDLSLFPTSPRAILCKWARLTQIFLTNSYVSGSRKLSIKDAHTILSSCCMLEHCSMDIYDGHNAASPTGPIFLPHLRSLAILEGSTSLTTLFATFEPLPMLRALSFESGLWPSSGTSSLIELLSRTYGQVAYLAMSLRYYTFADINAIFGLVPALSHLQEESGRLGARGRMRMLPRSFSIKTALLKLLTPAEEEGSVLLPLLRTLKFCDSVSVSEVDLLAFIRNRMVAACDLTRRIAPLRKISISFIHPPTVDIRSELLPYTGEAGPLELDIHYHHPNFEPPRHIDPTTGLRTRKLSPLIQAGCRDWGLDS